MDLAAPIRTTSVPMADMARESIAHNPKASGILNKGLLPLASADWDITPAEGEAPTAPKDADDLPF